MIRTKGEAGTGDVVHAVKHMRQIVQEMRILTVLGEEELYAKAKEHQAPYELVRWWPKQGSCRCRISRPEESPPRPTRRWSCSWARKPCSSAPASSCRIRPTFADPEEAEKRAKAIVHGRHALQRS